MQMDNYALRIHLQRAQETNCMSSHHNRDIFWSSSSILYLLSYKPLLRVMNRAHTKARDSSLFQHCSFYKNYHHSWVIPMANHRGKRGGFVFLKFVMCLHTRFYCSNSEGSESMFSYDPKYLTEFAVLVIVHDVCVLVLTLWIRLRCILEWVIELHTW